MRVGNYCLLWVKEIQKLKFTIQLNLVPRVEIEEINSSIVQLKQMYLQFYILDCKGFLDQ